MKARFFALAALVLGMVSCQQEFDGAAQVGGEVDFQLSVAAPELSTRADADGRNGHDSAYGAIDYLSDAEWESVDLRYTLEVYDADALDAVPVKDRQVIIVDKYEPVTFDLRLVPNRAYQFVVFADFVEEDAVDTPTVEAQAEIGKHHIIGATLQNITLKADAINDECTDAYFASERLEITNSAAKDIVLKRPYGKVRVVATDLAELNLNVEAASVKVTYTAANANAFNAVTGAISGEGATTFESVYALCDEYTAGYDALTATALNGKVRQSHKTLFTDYILATTDQKTIHFTMEVFDANGGRIKETNFNTEIPVQRNYLTTIVGNVLTTATEINVTIDDNFAGEENVDVVEVNDAVELQEAINNASSENETHIVLTGDINLNDLLGLTRAEVGATLVIEKGKVVNIDLGNHTLSAIDTTEKNYELIKNAGTLVVKNGTMKVEATVNSGWNRYSAVIANTVGGNLTVENVTIQHLGGTDMAYGIDNLTNGKGTYAVTTIKNSTVTSPYRAVRQFLNGVEAQNELYVMAGTVLNGENKSIFFHDPSTNANTGKLVVEEGATLNGDVYLFVTAGSTEWPVEVSIAASALAEGKEVITGNVPAGYFVVEKDGYYVVDKGLVINGNEYVVMSASGLVYLSENGLKAGDSVKLGADIDLTGVEFNGLDTFHPENNNTFDGQGFTVSNWTNNSNASDMGFIRNWVGTVKNVNFENCHLKTSGRSAIAAAKVYGNIENVTINNCSIEDSYWACGLVAGLYNAGNISDCTVTNSSVKSNGGTGAIVGVINETAGTRKVENCKVEGCTVNNTGAYGAIYSGALVCGMINISNSTVDFTGCSYNNNKKVGKYVGDLFYAADEDITVVVTGATVVRTAAELTEALSKNENVVLAADIDCGTTQLAISGANQVVNLNGHTLKTQMSYGGMAIKNGASIKNGTIEHTSTVAAIKAFNVGSIENVTIKTTCTTADKTITAIAVQQGGYVGAIKNVNIEGVSQGIEVGYQATVDTIENTVVNERTNGTANGIGLVINGGKVGLAKNSTFKGDAYGVTMHLKGVFAVGLELENCKVEGATA